MKILTVSTFDKLGAGRAAYRTHTAILEAGIDAELLVLEKSLSDSTIKSINKNFRDSLISKMHTSLERIFVKIYRKRIKSQLFSPAILSKGIVKYINSSNCDVVHFHWINKGLIHLSDIGKIKKPVIFTLHDMWAFTGGCHYDNGCGKYTNKCFACPVLSSKMNYDLSTFIFNKKRKSYTRLKPNPVVIGLSKWLADCAKKSVLFRDYTVLNLPNPIDTDFYKPIDKNIARSILNIKADKPIILFTGLDATDDIRKGFYYLKEALSLLPEYSYYLLFTGSINSVIASTIKQHLISTERLNDEYSMVLLYSAVDICIVPSLQENLSNVIMESLSCGTPVTAFNIGGNPDMINHKKNGYLAKEKDFEDLANGIEWVTSWENQKQLSENARKTVLEKYSKRIVSQQYINLYTQILNIKNS